MSAGDPPPIDPREIRRRIEAWRQTGDLMHLWPDVDPVDLRAAHAGIRAVTEAVLAAEDTGTAGSPAEEVLAADDEGGTRALGVAAFQAGMGPLLGWWVEQGRVHASPEVQAVLGRHLEHGRRRIARLRERLEAVLRAMRSRNVEPVLLKGLHTGSEYFPRPEVRPAADLDLLVRPEERDRAADALSVAGLVEARRTRFADRSEWVPRDRTPTVRSLELEHADDPWSVDLHTALERWYFRGLRRGLGPDVFRRTAETSVGGLPVRVLGQPDLTAFLALHASHELVKVRLVRIVELVRVIRTDVARGRLDLGELEARVGETGTGRFVHPALWLAETLAPGTVPSALLDRFGTRATSRARRVLAAVEAADLAPLTRPSIDAKLMWARGLGQLLLNLSEVVVPSDEGLEVGLARLQWRRLVALVRRRAGWRAKGGGG